MAATIEDIWWERPMGPAICDAFTIAGLTDGSEIYTFEYGDDYPQNQVTPPKNINSIIKFGENKIIVSVLGKMTGTMIKKDGTWTLTVNDVQYTLIGTGLGMWRLNRIQPFADAFN